MYKHLKEKMLESISQVWPITAIVLALSIFIVPMGTGSIVVFFVGAILLTLGMAMFQLGTEMSMSPLGEGIGIELSKSKKVILILGVALLMGILITVAEPDLAVLSNQVPSVPNAVLIWTVAIGVGIFLALAAARIIFKIDLSILLIGLYILVLIFSYFVPKDFIAVAFDSGGVTTGPVTVPFIMAMGVGLCAIRSDKEAVNDSFGLVALSSVGPILAVMLLGIFYQPDGASYAPQALVEAELMSDVFWVFASGLPHYFAEVATSIFPIFGVFFVFQLLRKRYTKVQVLRIIVGFFYTYLGLVMFLCGVNVGFAPVGTLLGRELGTGWQRWLLVPVGMLIGYFIVKAEPAIQILNRQVHSVTEGSVSEKAMNLCLSIGVAISIGLAMLRILIGFPIQYIVIPGYIVALVMSRMVPKIFVGIAFDSGGVASGPMTSTFLLPLCIGVCEALGGNVMTDAFGVVSLVALTPLIAIQIMGIVYNIRIRKMSGTMTNILPEDSDNIVELKEDF